ncbi:MAG: polysaccharide biosynthesis protein, partial [Clostridiales bacterium]|nr:polysaccharide biosynthesis protein [Clostridiales bacterium]
MDDNKTHNKQNKFDTMSEVGPGFDKDLDLDFRYDQDGKASADDDGTVLYRRTGRMYSVEREAPMGSADKGSDTSSDMASETDNGALPGSDELPGSSSRAASRLMQGATILAIAGIVSKMFGAIFRIPLTNMIGAEGQSYYGAAYPVYQLFYVVATAGFPVAISRMVSERIAHGDYINAHKSYKIALKTTIVVSLIAFSVCFFGADIIAGLVKNSGAALSIRAISIALLFTPIAASLRGYFQGNQRMTPTAVSQVVEQMVRVAVGLALAFLFFRTSLQRAAAGATFGASAGMIAAMVVLLVIYFRQKDQRAAEFKRSVIRIETDRQRFRELVEIVIPITIGSAIMPLMNTIDLAVIMRRLQATGWDLKMSQTLY